MFSWQFSFWGFLFFFVFRRLTIGFCIVRLSAKPSNPKRVRKDVDERVAKLVLILGKKVLPRRQLVADLGLKQKSRRVFIYNYMKPTWEQGLIDFSYTAVPHKPEQAYRLTAKGLELYAELTGESAYV